MIDPAPVERVVSLLQEGGYVRLGSPVNVGGVPFEFNAVLVGSDRAFDVVVVVDTVAEPDRRLRQRIEALARALDVSGSRRSLTVVTVGPPPGTNSLDALSRVARVLVVYPPANAGATSLRDALAVLLPLNLPSSSSNGTSDPFGEVVEWLADDPGREQLRGVVSAAARGKEHVSAALADLLGEPLTELEGK